MADLPDYYTQISALEAEAYSLRGGADVSKSASPEGRDVYLATDTEKIYYCCTVGSWADFIATHAALTTGVHGAGASTLASVADIATHAALTTGVHGVGANTLIHSGNTIASLTAPAADFSMNTHKITNVVDPTANQHAATKVYVDSAIDTDVSTHADLTTGIHGVGAGAIVGTTLAQALTNKTLTTPVINGAVTTTGLTLPAHALSGNIDAAEQAITNIRNIWYSALSEGYIRSYNEAGDIALRIYTTGVTPGFAQTERLRINGRAAEVTVAWYNSIQTGIKLGGALNANSNLINSVTDPTAAQDAATKAYVDAGAKVANGSYTGDNSVNRAIAHGLGATPKIVLITDVTTPVWFRQHPDAAAIYYLDPSTGGNYAVTIMDATNFYVGNATSYYLSGNATGKTCYWVAIK